MVLWILYIEQRLLFGKQEAWNCGFRQQFHYLNKFIDLAKQYTTF